MPCSWLSTPATIAIFPKQYGKNPHTHLCACTQIRFLTILQAKRISLSLVETNNRRGTAPVLSVLNDSTAGVLVEYWRSTGAVLAQYWHPTLRWYCTYQCSYTYSLLIFLFWNFFSTFFFKFFLFKIFFSKGFTLDVCPFT